MFIVLFIVTKFGKPIYDELIKKIPNIEFNQGFPENLSDFQPLEPSLIIFDDLMKEAMNDQSVSCLFTAGSHHLGISVIFVIQNLFFQGKESRNISLNAHYIVLMKIHGSITS